MGFFLTPASGHATAQPLWIIPFALPSFVLLAVMAWFKHAYHRDAKRQFTELPSRLPGESAQLKADQHREKALDGPLLLLLFAPTVGAAVAFAPFGHSRPLVWASAIVMGVVFATFCPRVLFNLRKSFDYQLGASGERVIGHTLNQLLASGYRVFHDVPFPGYNVDHVVVGPSGLYMIETKTRRKKYMAGKGSTECRVVFDGRRLMWAGRRTDPRSVAQAERTARDLTGWLAQATGERVPAQPVIAIPGWFVECRARGDVTVVSGKELPQLFSPSSRRELAAAQIQRISHQLSQRCEVQVN